MKLAILHLLSCGLSWGCLTADLPSILQLSFLRTFVVVLVSCLDSAVFMEYSLDHSIIWGGWTFGGRVKVIFANWVHFQTSYFSKRQNSVDGFKIQKNQQFKQDFLSELCFDSRHYQWKYFSWKWKWMMIIRSMCSVCHILKFLNMQRNFGYSAVRETFFSNRRFVEILLFRFVLIFYATEIS